MAISSASKTRSILSHQKVNCASRRSFHFSGGITGAAQGQPNQVKRRVLTEMLQALARGWEHDQLVLAILDAAIERHGLKEKVLSAGY